MLFFCVVLLNFISTQFTVIVGPLRYSFLPFYSLLNVDVASTFARRKKKHLYAQVKQIYKQVVDKSWSSVLFLLKWLLHLGSTQFHIPPFCHFAHLQPASLQHLQDITASMLK